MIILSKDLVSVEEEIVNQGNLKVLSDLVRNKSYYVYVDRMVNPLLAVVKIN